MFQKYKLLIPTLVLLILSAWTLFNSGIDYSLTFQHYLGLTGALLCTLSFFAFRKFYKYILGATLLLGLINLFNFTPSQITTSFSFNNLSIGFQPYSLFVIILTGVLAMPKKGEVNVIQSENLLIQNEQQLKEDVEKYKGLFAAKSSTELAEIIEGKKHTAAAIEAAKQMLDRLKS